MLDWGNAPFWRCIEIGLSLCALKISCKREFLPIDSIINLAVPGFDYIAWSDRYYHPFLVRLSDNESYMMYRASNAYWRKMPGLWECLRKAFAWLHIWNDTSFLFLCRFWSGSMERLRQGAKLEKICPHLQRPQLQGQNTLGSINKRYPCFSKKLGPSTRVHGMERHSGCLSVIW